METNVYRYLIVRPCRITIGGRQFVFRRGGQQLTLSPEDNQVFQRLYSSQSSLYRLISKPDDAPVVVDPEVDKAAKEKQKQIDEFQAALEESQKAKQEQLVELFTPTEKPGVEKVEPEANSEEASDEEKQTYLDLAGVDLKVDDHWKTVSEYINDMVEADEVSQQKLEVIQSAFPSYSSIQKKVKALLQDLAG